MIQHRKNKGLTLIELIISIVVLGIALGGIIGMLSIFLLKSVDPIVSVQGWALMRGLMDEIVGKDYTSPGAACTPVNPSKGEYDKICDYGAIVNSAANSTLFPNLGTDTSLSDYTLSVSISSGINAATGSTLLTGNEIAIIQVSAFFQRTATNPGTLIGTLGAYVTSGA